MRLRLAARREKEESLTRRRVFPRRDGHLVSRIPSADFHLRIACSVGDAFVSCRPACSILGHRDSCYRRFNSRESFQRINELKVDADDESTLIRSLVEFVVLELRHETVIFEISMPGPNGQESQ